MQEKADEEEELHTNRNNEVTGNQNSKVQGQQNSAAFKEEKVKSKKYMIYLNYLLQNDRDHQLIIRYM